jgi:2-oxoglutarate ferredoxin oxidoreductase subunit gamma
VPDYGLIIYDPAFVEQIDEGLPCAQKAIPAKELSVENFDNALFANTLMLGVVAKLVDVLEKDVVLESVLAIIPKFHDRNRQAFQLGFEYVD